MKKFGIIMVVFLVTLSSFSQKWEHIYGEPNRKEIAEDIIELYDKGYYILGTTEGENELYVAWNIKTDINGNSLYDKLIYHDLYTQVNYSSDSDNNGNIYTCGTILLNDTWPIVTKYNSCGQKVWCKVFVPDQFTYGWATDLIINNNGEIIVLVYLDSEDQVDQIFLYCLNSEGDLLWTKPFASKYDHQEIGFAIGNNFYQYNNSYFIDGYCYWPYPGNPNQVFQRPLFIKIDSLFNEEWILPFGISDSIVGKAWRTIQFSDNLFMGACMLRLEGDVEHSLIVYFNENGEELEHFEIPNDSIGPEVSQNYIVDIVQINDSLFLASIPVGYNNTWYEYGDFIIDSTGRIYNFVMRENTKGYSNILKTTNNDYVIAVEIEEGKSDRDILLYKIDENLESVPFDTNTYVYDSLCPGGIQSGSIDITDCLIWTDVKEMPSPKEYFASLQTVNIKAYPNPAKKSDITLSFTNTEHFENMELRCFDVFGKEVHSEKIYQHQGEVKLNTSNWKKGIYLAIVYNGFETKGRCKFIISN